tara:strand:+ start:9255 stop:10331 length:1077 start_codon:yes stop_codon:yes gene_type:complete
MNSLKDKILIVGGYGAVGSIVSKILTEKYPKKVIIAGRNKDKANDLINKSNIEALPIKIDLESNYFDEINFEEVHTAICCIEYLKNDNFIHSCIKNQVNYTELATSYEAYLRLTNYNDEVEKSGICLVPGVGLMPGLSGVFVQNAISRLNKINSVQSFVLLGLGENHGLDAIRWMMEYANKTYTLKTEHGEELVSSFTNPRKEQLLNEKHSRKFYRFNFGDQHIIANSVKVNFAETRLAFDSSFVTWLMAVMKKINLLTKLSKIKPQTLKKWLTKFSFGSENFGIQTHCYGENMAQIIYLAEGIKEAKATGIIAAYTVSNLYQTNNKIGVKRLEEIIQFEEFVKHLKENQINIKIKEV